jgi:hypothetical protein
VAAGDTVLVAGDEAARAAAGAPGIDAAVVARVRGADVLPGRPVAEAEASS